LPAYTLTAKRRLGLAGLATACVLAAAAPATAQTGGSGPPGGTTTTTTTTPTPTTPGAPPGRAKLRKDGTAVPPADAPPAVVAAINAGNAIHTLPYKWGGGHNTSFVDSGYDCSGAVSYLLHAAGLLTSPMPSGSFASSWGVAGKGRWITVYANAGHMYVVVAGLRYDTSAVGEKLNQGSGPRWRKTKRPARGYTAKYFPGY
jgi:hypothetical protein